MSLRRLAVRSGHGVVGARHLLRIVVSTTWTGRYTWPLVRHRLMHGELLRVVSTIWIEPVWWYSIDVLVPEIRQILFEIVVDTNS